MAGDWMKVELETPDKPEIQYMAGMLNLDPDAVVGKLIRVWAWFNKHTENCNARGVTYSFLDRITNCTGFAEAMALAGWLVQDGHMLSLPNGDRHNGKTAKNRAVTNSRVAAHRKSNDGSNADVTTDVTPTPLQKSLPEKRREEEKKPTPSAEQIFWDEGPKYLSAKGTPDATARTFLGRLVKAHGIAEAMRALEAAMQSQTGDPRAYMTRVLEPQSRHHGGQLRAVV